jgi:hypothetical protein
MAIKEGANANGAFAPGEDTKENDTYYEELRAIYSNVLDASGINFRDPAYQIMTRFSKTQKRLTVDPPYVGKTYIFMTRPDLNFGGGDRLLESSNRIFQSFGGHGFKSTSTGYHNVMKNDIFAYFSRTEIGRYVFPWLMYPYGWEYSNDKGIAEATFMDITGFKEFQLVTEVGGVEIPDDAQIWTPFIPMITNLCTSLSGGKDIALETYETEGDFSGNRLKYATGADDSFGPGEVTLDCADINGSPLLHMSNIWVNYIHLLCKGLVVPKARYVRYRTLDYTSSIYVFMTDKDGTTITRWAKYTGCFPGSVPLGAIQHNLEPNVEALRNLSLNFHYNRYEAMKPEILSDFNYLMMLFMKKWDKTEKQYIKNVKGTIISEGGAPPSIGGNSLSFSLSSLPLIGFENSKIKSAAEILEKNPEWWGAPQIKDGESNRIKRKYDYDSMYYGRIPFILNNSLIWIR